MSGSNTLTIIGCGSVGTALLQLIAFRSIEDYSSIFETIEIIDPDLVIKDDLRYPKVFETEDKLLLINPNLKIKSIHTNAIFPNCIKERDNSSHVFIDCRDTSEQSDLCYMKICSDGPYGKIIMYPKTRIGGPTNYRIQKSNYFAMLTASVAIETIFRCKLPYRKKENTEKVIVINHTVSL